MTQKPGWDPPEGGGPAPWETWGRGGDFPRWRHQRVQWERHRGRLFLRFAATFGFIVLLVLGGMAALAFLLTRLAGGDGHIAGLVWVGGCGLSLALPILALGLAVRAFRRIATPLAEVMSAADAVANGDLSVRVPVHGPGDFQRLAISFNRMTEELAARRSAAPQPHGRRGPRAAQPPAHHPGQSRRRSRRRVRAHARTHRGHARGGPGPRCGWSMI